MRVLHGLPGFEVMAAALAFVIVGGHGWEVRWGFEPPREKAEAQYAAPPCRCKRIFPFVQGASKLRRGWFDRRLLAADDAFGLRGAFVDRVAAGDEQLAEVFAAEAEVVSRFGCGNDEVHASSLIADLDAERGGDVEPAIGVDKEIGHASDASQISLDKVEWLFLR